MKKELNKVEGVIGETLASQYLKKEKYKIIEQNYKNKIGEIDIIAMKKDKIIFVEVKARKTLRFGRPSEAVDERKQDKIRRTATLYLLQKGYMDRAVQFDVIEIIGDEEINHIENAF